MKQQGYNFDHSGKIYLTVTHENASCKNPASTFPHKPIQPVWARTPKRTTKNTQIEKRTKLQAQSLFIFELTILNLSTHSRTPVSITRNPTPKSSRNCSSSFLSDHSYFYLSRILHLVLDLL
jgi:hypothetical protein